MLEALGPGARDPLAHARWRLSASALCGALGWTASQPIVRPHASGTLLAFAAPADALFTATEINEWAWEQASGIFAPGFDTVIDPPFDQLHALGADFAMVVNAFEARVQAERNPALTALRAAAADHGIPIFIDDTDASLGAGAGSQTWPLTALPAAESVAWAALRDIPKVLVTGSNGKTTTVRLLSALLAAGDAMLRGHVGYSSTEGVVIGGMSAGEGDFSGPAGARLVLRDRCVEVAVLETARGGILRRGLAVEKADVAIVTNISADHFGEYGIDSLDDLADVKLSVAHALGVNGTLVLNADDPVLRARVPKQRCLVALFAFDDAHPALVANRLTGGATCGLVDEEMWLTDNNVRASLGSIHGMPLTLDGAATYNVANISAAVLAASALGVPAEIMASVIQCFGGTRQDNPGRLGCWYLDDVTVLVDYAHNPGGLGMLLAASRAMLNGKKDRIGRLGLLLGQAGNRTNQAIADIAATAATFHPDLIVVKELSSMLRGRAPGEVSTQLNHNLLATGYPAEKIQIEADEVNAARQLLRWAQAGDVLVLPIHQSASRKALSALLDQMESARWQVGSALPAAETGIVSTEI